MPFKHIKLLKGSSWYLTTRDRVIMNSIVKCLKNTPKHKAQLGHIYEFVWKDIKPSIRTIDIKYCILLLHVKNIVSISNRIKPKSYRTRWKTHIILRKKAISPY